jgi:hypothetical protein
MSVTRVRTSDRKIRSSNTDNNLFGVYCQLGDGLIWSQEAAGASPVTPTIFISDNGRGLNLARSETITNGCVRLIICGLNMPIKPPRCLG